MLDQSREWFLRQQRERQEQMLLQQQRQRQQLEQQIRIQTQQAQQHVVQAQHLQQQMLLQQQQQRQQVEQQIRNQTHQAQQHAVRTQQEVQWLSQPSQPSQPPQPPQPPQQYHEHSQWHWQQLEGADLLRNMDGGGRQTLPPSVAESQCVASDNTAFTDGALRATRPPESWPEAWPLLGDAGKQTHPVRSAREESANNHMTSGETLSAKARRNALNEARVPIVRLRLRYPPGIYPSSIVHRCLPRSCGHPNMLAAAKMSCYLPHQLGICVAQSSLSVPRRYCRRLEYRGRRIPDIRVRAPHLRL